MLKIKRSSVKKILVSLTVVTLIGLIGCQEKGPGAKAGERFDEVVDNVKHGDSPLKEKGAMEKVGESIDDSLDKADKKLK